MENYKDKVTKGKVEVRYNMIISGSVDRKGFTIASLGTIGIPKEESEANSNLIAESFNVLQDSGYTPSELLAQNKELLEALKELLFKYEFNLNKNQKNNMHLDEVYHKAQQAITNATK